MLFSGLTVLVAGLVLGAPAFAHSVEDTERLLGEREKYFQSFDREAPAFELQDSEVQVVRLADLHGKVVVLHIIFASCLDVCPLHADRIAEIPAPRTRRPYGR